MKRGAEPQSTAPAAVPEAPPPPAKRRRARRIAQEALVTAPAASAAPPAAATKQVAKKRPVREARPVSDAVKGKAERIRQQLEGMYKDVPIPLDHSSHFQLLIAVMLSAQARAPTLLDRGHLMLDRTRILLIRDGLQHSRAGDLWREPRPTSKRYADDRQESKRGDAAALCRGP